MTDRTTARLAAGNNWWVRAALAALVPALAALLAACADGGPTTGPVPVATVEVSPAEYTLAPGASHRLGAVVKAADGQLLTDRQVVWQSADTSRVRVSANGTVTAVRPGTVLVTATVEGKAGSARIVVPQPAPGPVVEVVVTPSFAELAPGQTIGVAAVALDADGQVVHGLPVTWSVSDDAVLMLEPNTQVRALTPGVAVVNATIAGHAGSALVHVLYPMPLVQSLTPAAVQAGSGAKEVVVRGSGFNRQSVVRVGGAAVPAVWVTGTELRAQVPADRFTAVGVLPVSVVNPAPGGGASNVLSIQVTAPAAVQYVYLEGGGHAWVGESLQLTARAVDAQNRPIEGLPVTWQSGNPTRATVDAQGRVTTLAAGNAEISATVGGFTQRTLVIGVTPPALDLLYDDGIDVYRTSLGVGRPTVRVVEGGTDAALSPDGTRLAFVRATPAGQTDIWVADADGSNQVRLTADAAEDDQPAWSPDGARLAFRSTRGGWSDIWVMNADGSEPRNLTGSEVRVGYMVARHPAWSPDGGTIAYSLLNLTYAPATAGLYTVPAAGGQVRRLVDSLDLVEYPAWDRDMIYARVVTATGSNTIQWFNASTGNPYVMPLVHAVAHAPALSADRNWLIYGSDARPGFSDLMVHGGGMEYRRLPLNPLTGRATARNPVWVAR